MMHENKAIDKYFEIGAKEVDGAEEPKVDVASLGAKVPKISKFLDVQMAAIQALTEQDGDGHVFQIDYPKDKMRIMILDDPDDDRDEDDDGDL